MKKNVFPILLLTSLFLVGCGPDEIINKTPVNPYNLLTYSEYDESTQTLGLTPNTGDVKMLVVPVEFKEDEAFSNNDLNRMNAVFNGEGEEKNTSYWESVSSYYSKASYNNLNLEFDITDVFTSTVTKTEFISHEFFGPNEQYGSIKLLNDMYSSLTIDGQKINYQDYDSDKDGYVDGVWLIYNSGTESEVWFSGYFWAYTYYLQNEPNLDSPTFNTFANGSQLFFNRDTRSFGYDSHTMIHETGHMLGLDDYYSYDDDLYYDASGGLMMMNLNIGDHDAFSKYSLGWINPTIITEETEITLKPFNEIGDAIIIPSDSFYNGPFGEYLIIQYYTHNGLNELDSKQRYPDRTGTLLYDESGIIVYHIDSRLINATSSDGINYVANLIDPTTYQFKDYSINDYVLVSGSNTPSYSAISEDYSLVELITSTNIPILGAGFSGNSALFKENDTFNPLTFNNFFTEAKFNDGSNIEFSFNVTSLTSEGATLSFQKVS